MAGLGHEVIAREIDVREVGSVTAREHPDVALVGLGLSSEHALDLITEIVHEASCPVIALLSARDPAYIGEAAKRGIFAYIVDASAEELRSAIDITLQRFSEYNNLQGAFGRRAVIEQAKGILSPPRNRPGEGVRTTPLLFPAQRPQADRRRPGRCREPPTPAASVRTPAGRRTVSDTAAQKSFTAEEARRTGEQVGIDLGIVPVRAWHSLELQRLRVGRRSGQFVQGG